MNAVILSVDGVPVTTSLAIAEGTKTDHASVIKLVRAYQADLEEFGRVGFEIQPFETAGGTQQREVSILNEQQATLLITYMRNSDIVRSFKKRLVKNFWDMRRPAAPAIPHTLSAALRLAADQADQIEQQQAQLAIAKPKAEALDRIADADGSMCITDAAKHLQMQPKRLFSWLAANDWIYRRPCSACWTAYQPRLKSGVLDHKVTMVARGDGTEKVVAQVLVTAKGLVKLAEVAAQ